jgi:anaerobic ribonucleoside-triphosphate reductase
VNSDKNYDILEKQLKTLGQKIRLDILTKLDNYNEPIPYSILLKEVLGTNANSSNFSFHLKMLKSNDLIDSTDFGYSISRLGRQILQKILSIDQILNDQDKVTMIRTSKYSKEPFNINKIEEYLIIEGKMEKILAKQIAREVEERLSRTKINYMTTPLMREYINAILLENGLEEVRHRLTRLGTPPFEIEQYFKSEFLNPEQFINKLGSESSEQYLLLNLLPKRLADLYLSGEIILLNLNHWSLRPLSLHLNTKSILDSIKDYKDDQKYVSVQFLEILKSLCPFISGDLVLSNFNSAYLSQFNNSNDLSYILTLLYPLFLGINTKPNDFRPHLTLEFTSSKNHQMGDLKIPIEDVFKVYLSVRNQYIKRNHNKLNPTILYDYSCRNFTEEENYNILNTISSTINSDIIFINGEIPKILDSHIVNIKKPDKNLQDKNSIILDKILINLHKISLDSEKVDDLFYDILKERLDQVFELFKYKKQFVYKKLESLNGWKNLQLKYFNFDDSGLLDNAVNSISFFGLNEAVEYHCGIELDRISTSEKFALNILSSMKKIIEEKNNDENELFSLSQPHNCNYIYHLAEINRLSDDQKSLFYTSNIIREECKLPLDEKIQIFKKFEKLLDGGSLFQVKNENGKNSFINFFNSLSKSSLSAFLIN